MLDMGQRGGSASQRSAARRQRGSTMPQERGGGSRRQSCRGGAHVAIVLAGVDLLRDQVEAVALVACSGKSGQHRIRSPDTIGVTFAVVCCGGA